MASDPTTTPDEHDKVDAKTPDDPESGKLTLGELAMVTGGGDGDSAWFSSPGPWDPA